METGFVIRQHIAFSHLDSIETAPQPMKLLFKRLNYRLSRAEINKKTGEAADIRYCICSLPWIVSKPLIKL